MMKTKKAIKIVERAGGVWKRGNGSHQVYELPNRECIAIPHSGAHLELSKHVQCQLRKALPNCGF